MAETLATPFSGSGVTKNRILTIVDEKGLLEEVRRSLENDAELVTVMAGSVDVGFELALQLKPQLILLDAALAGRPDGAVWPQLRSNWETREVPLLVLLDPANASERVFAQTRGVDGYVGKPLVPEELLEKVREILRSQHSEVARKQVFDDGHLYVHFDSYVVRVNGRGIQLALKEFSLLKFLIQNEGRVFSREKLLEVVWKYHRFGKTRTVDVHVRRLRKKLGLEGEGYIQTIIGVGYRFNPAQPVC